MAHLEASKVFSVEGLVAVITGGGTGLGLIMAQALDANGAAKVFVIGRREHKLQEAAASAKNGNIVPVVGDVSCKDSLQKAYDQVSAVTGHVDLVVANSGISGPAAAPKPKPDGEEPTLAELRDHLWPVPMAEFTEASHVNVTGAFYTAVAFLPLLEAANKRRAELGGTGPRPQVILTTSAAGFMRLTASYAYNASKAGANHLVKVMATMLATHHIRVNGIAPGVFYSELSMEKYHADGIKDKGVKDGSFAKHEIPLTRSGSEDDMAGIILWMAGNAGGYLNGSVIMSDGGILSAHPSTY